jgi:16S rRNA (cytosine967-C5)-methyltransferase
VISFTDTARNPARNWAKHLNNQAMPVSPARSAAFDILLQVEREDAYASDLLHSSRYEKLSKADHALATEIVMGVLRWRSLLDAELARFSSQKLVKLDTEVLTSLRMAVFQLMLLDRVPAHAVLHDAVELVKRARKRSAAPFVNALLRKVSAHAEWIVDLRQTVTELAKAPSGDPTLTVTVTHRPSPEQSVRYLADRYAHPHWTVERWVKAYGVDKTRDVLRWDQQIPTMAIRLPAPEDESSLEKSGVAFLNGALLKTAARVKSGDLTRTEAFRSGRIVIQDEASQLVAMLVGGGERILDCCAAPGGKTRLIAERNPAAKIVAAELHPRRARLLRQRVAAKNVEVVSADIRESPLRGHFDRVLADVPCSGTGTLQRNPEIKWRLSRQDLRDLQAKQIAILISAMKCTSPLGRVIYSTCSLEPEENEAVVEKALAVDSSFRIRPCRGELESLEKHGELVWADVASLLSGPFLRTIPGVHPCDGFFAAILEKK